MQITIDHKTNDAKTTNSGPHIGLIIFFATKKGLKNYRQAQK